MALPESVLQSINISGSDIAAALSNLPGFSTLIKIGQIAGILVIAYLVFLIIRSLMQIRYAFSMRKLIKNVEDINKKIDSLIGKRKK